MCAETLFLVLTCAASIDVLCVQNLQILVDSGPSVIAYGAFNEPRVARRPNQMSVAGQFEFLGP